MSANPTRVDWEATTSPLQEGNRVLESIARQEALRALLAFSSLHEQIRERQRAEGRPSDRDLFETERFILDEVLQLICARAQAITRADGIVVALAEKPAAGRSAVGQSTTGQSTTERSTTGRAGMVCRAAAGPLTVERGVRLGESEFLQDCLESGRILRCDDSQIDGRVELDLACQMGARSTVLIPLRGRREQLGVLQAFSRTAWAFTDQDVRCFDLFAELVLSALRPEDQDRRIHWLSDVAEEVLATKTAAPQPVVARAAAIETTEPALPSSDLDLDLDLDLDSKLHLAALAQPVVIPAEMVELPAAGLADEPVFSAEFSSAEPGATGDASASLPFLQSLSLGGSSHPGLNVVLGLVAVAALFSAGAWWGMREHGMAPAAKVAAARVTLPRQTVTAPSEPASEFLSLAISDNLMNPEKPGSDSPLTAVAESKLAALPKITGVRHWTSSVGSTVVIDMEDQAPYEVHRLISPERIYFDLHDTVLSPELSGKTMDVGDTSLTRVRIGQPVAGVTRVVLDTKEGTNFSVSMESSPYRLVVELRGSETSLAGNDIRLNQTPGSAEAAPAALKAAPVVELAAKASDQRLPARTLLGRTGKFRIVLDAGHGGWDLGTVGRQGLLEKDLVLDVTQRLGKLLQARLGSEVMFTRTGDTYLPLDLRADMANEAQADLFVSVHANYSDSATARGVETYYTNLFSAPGSREAEKHDDGTFSKLTPVSLSADGMHEKIEESRRLAASVQRSLYATLAAKSPDIRNRGIKDSAFAVLTGTTMPSILTEISFVSSPADEHNLQTESYRQQIAEALYQGIARYEQSSPRAKVAQLQTVPR